MITPPNLLNHFCNSNEMLDKIPCNNTPKIENINVKPKTKNTLLQKILKFFCILNYRCLFPFLMFLKILLLFLLTPYNFGQGILISLELLGRLLCQRQTL